MRRKTLLLLLLICFIGFGLRLMPVRMDYHYWDETVYLQHAEIIAGESPNNYNEFEFRPPLFPLLLVPVILISSTFLAVHVYVSLLASLGILVTYWLASELYGSRTGLASAMVYAASPLAIRLSHEILVDALLPVLWLITAFLMYRSLETEKILYYGLTGMFAGLAVLMKFTSLVILPALAMVLLVKKMGDKESLLEVEFYRSLLTSKNHWSIPAGFAAAMSPYLIWSYLSFGSPLHVFSEALKVSGAPDAFMTYFNGMDTFILAPLYLGVLVFFWKSGREFDDFYPLAFLLAILIPAQFWLGNKELRFLLPGVPFLAMIAARGFSRVDVSLKGREIDEVVIVSVLILLSVSLLFGNLNNRSAIDKGLFMDEWHPPIEDAAAWLREETNENAIVYTNYRYPPLGYYSKREIRYISNSEPLDKKDLEPGYIYYSEDSPFDYPDLETLESDPDFVLNKSFEKTVKIFYYKGKK